MSPQYTNALQVIGKDKSHPYLRAIIIIGAFDLQILEVKESRVG
jgi:hypothetical protein